MKTTLFVTAAIISTAIAPMVNAQPKADPTNTICVRNDRTCNQEYRPSNFSRIEARAHRDDAYRATAPVLNQKMLNDRQLYWGYAARYPIATSQHH